MSQPMQLLPAAVPVTYLLPLLLKFLWETSNPPPVIANSLQPTMVSNQRQAEWAVCCIPGLTDDEVENAEEVDCLVTAGGFVADV